MILKVPSIPSHSVLLWSVTSKGRSFPWPNIWTLLPRILKRILSSWGIRVEMGKIRHGEMIWFWCWSLLNLDAHPSRFTNLLPWSAVGIVSTSYGIGCRVHVRPALACTVPGHIPCRKRENNDLKRNLQLAVKPASAFWGTNARSQVLYHLE